MLPRWRYTASVYRDMDKEDSFLLTLSGMAKHAKDGSGALFFYFPSCSASSRIHIDDRNKKPLLEIEEDKHTSNNETSDQPGFSGLLVRPPSIQFGPESQVI